MYMYCNTTPFANFANAYGIATYVSLIMHDITILPNVLQIAKVSAYILIAHS